MQIQYISTKNEQMSTGRVQIDAHRLLVNFPPFNIFTKDEKGKKILFETKNKKYIDNYHES